ncbi:MAG: tandem-95 repeat protein, partial [Planctomycetes bacterium]|nr:tandem-95 repeat protein [Planctomycetota bacterium]
PAANANGTLQAFTVRAWDGQAASASPVTVNVQVAAVNDVPTLTTIANLPGGTEDTDFTISHATLLGASNAADADGDALRFRIEAVSSGTLTKGGVPVVPGTTLLAAGESLVWHPAANANGTLGAFSVKAWDGQVASAAAIPVNVQVAAVNDVPTLTTITNLPGGTEDTDFTITYAALFAASNAADADGDPLSFRIEGVSSGTLTKGGVPVVPGATLLSAGESLVWRPAANANGTLQAFTVRAWDGQAASASPVTVNVQVAAVNDVPTLTAIANLPGASEDTDFTISYATLFAASNAADADGDPLSFRIEAVSSGTLTKGGLPVVPGATLLSAGESLVWHPAPQANGTLEAFRVTAWDGQAASATPTPVRVKVGSTNDPPTLTTISTLPGGTEDADFALSYDALLAASDAQDSELDPLSFRIEAVTNGTLTKAGLPVVPGVTLLSTGESLVWRPAPDANGTLQAFSVVAWDGQAPSAAPVPVAVLVAAVNDAPSFTKGTDQAVGEDAPAQSLPGWATGISPGPADEAAQALAFSVENDAPSLFAQQPALAPDGTLTWRPAPHAHGTATVTVVLRDDGGGSDASTPQTFTITVQPLIRYIGAIPAGGGAVVHVYDADATNDIALADMLVKPGTGNAISSITLVGALRKTGLGLVIAGASSAGKISDKRTLPSNVAFIAADAPLPSLALRSSLTGYNLNGLTLGGVPFAPDLDADGDPNDPSALWVQGSVAKLSLVGDLAADAIVQGSLPSVKITGSVAGDLRTTGSLGKASVTGGWTGAVSVSWVSSAKIGGTLSGVWTATGRDPSKGFSVGSLAVGRWGAGSILAAGVGPGLDGAYFTGDDAVLGGGVGKLTILAYDKASGSPFGLLAPLFGSIKLGALTPLLPFADAQFRIARVV